MVRPEPEAEGILRASLAAVTPLLSARSPSNFTPGHPRKAALGEPRIHDTRRAPPPVAQAYGTTENRAFPKKAFPEAVQRVLPRRVSYDPIGNTIRKTEPHPSWLVTLILPP